MNAHGGSGERMDVGHGKRMRMNVDGDRLSNLPDDLLHNILSFIDIIKVIRMSVLSSRWKFIWTSMPSLHFSTDNKSLNFLWFSKFLTGLFSHRNNIIDVYSVTLTKFYVRKSYKLIERILNYAFAHNIQQLNVKCYIAKEFPLSLFSSKSLKHLSLYFEIGRFHKYGAYSYLTSTWDLPALTILDLHSVILCDDEAEKCIGVLLKCVNLVNLSINTFSTNESNDGFSIVHPRLSNLTLQNGGNDVRVINVTTPQLKNMTIRSCHAELVISAPDLASLCYKGSGTLILSIEGFPSLEEADICISNPGTYDVNRIICLLQLLHNVKFLTLNLEIVKFLQKPSPFVNLKRLEIYPETLCTSKELHKKVTLMYTQLNSYLLDSSSESVTVVLREEILAQKLLDEFGEFLVKENKDILIMEREQKNDNILAVEGVTTKVDGHNWIIGGKMAQIERGWENLGVQFQRRKEKADLVISKLRRIEELLTKLPASVRAKIQPCFSRLCEKADVTIRLITHDMKVCCDENQSNSSGYLHELADLQILAACFLANC